MSIYTPVFTVFYFTLSICPLLFKKMPLWARIFHFALYVFTATLLTIFPITLNAEVININVHTSRQPLMFGSDLSPRNILLNAALVLPTSTFMFAIKKRTHTPFTGLKCALVCFIVGATVELLQLVLAFGRVIDHLDPIICGFFGFFWWLGLRCFNRQDRLDSHITCVRNNLPLYLSK